MPILDIKKTAFIMAHRDRQHCLNITLNSLYRSSRSNEIKLFMVDDNNGYDINKIVSTFTNNYEIIKNTYRMGADVSKAAGIGRALELGYKHVIILDDDLIFDMNWLLITLSLFYSLKEDEADISIITTFLVPYYRFDVHKHVKCGFCNAHLLLAHNTLPMSVGSMWDINLANRYYNELNQNAINEEYIVEYNFMRNSIAGKINFYVKDKPGLIGHYGRHSLRKKYEGAKNTDWPPEQVDGYLPECSSDVLEQINLIQNKNEWGKY